MYKTSMTVFICQHN